MEGAVLESRQYCSTRFWDGANRLVAINYTGFTTRSEFTYDGLNRVAKIVEKTGATINSTRKFVWCGQG